jgi:hypothetical protein
LFCFFFSQTDLLQHDTENQGIAPPSTGKKKKARRVFGNILSNCDLNHSLSYTPSPFKPNDSEETKSPSKSQERLVHNLFPIAESTRQSEEAGRKSEMSSSQTSTCRSETSTVVVRPFSHVIGSPNEKERDNSSNDISTSVPKSIRVPNEKSSVESLPFYTKEERLSKTGKPPRPRSSSNRVGVNADWKAGQGGSVNQALNAARRAKERALKEKAKAAAKIRGQWKEEKEEALDFYEESEKLRREQLNLQNQLSSNYSRTKAQRNQHKRQEQREQSDKEAIFKSDVAREQREKLKEMEDKRRRESIAVRAKIRSNNRKGAEKLKMMKIEEEMAIIDERYSTSQALQQYQRDQLDSTRKHFQFKRGDAIRIRELHDKMEQQRKREEHESFELMLAAARDTDEYKQKLTEERRRSLEYRNQEASEQRQKSEEQRSKQNQAEHESYELKWAGDLDADNYKQELEKQRRESLFLRGEEAKCFRDKQSQQEAENKKAEQESYQLKFEADRDVEAYKQSETLRRRKSLEQRGATAREIRNKQLQAESERLEKEHKSYELKFSGEKDTEEYRQKMAEMRRKSLEQRNKEAKQQREEEEKRQAKGAQLEHESYELKWNGERDVQEYVRQTEQQRRESLQFRNKQAREQRSLADTQRAAERQADQESFELKRAANKDVDEYRKKEEQERRESLAFRNQEKARHAKVMEELNGLAREQEAESYMLKWGGENDAKEYQAQLEEERRKSLQFRNEEGRRHREINDELHHKQVLQNQLDEELRAAGKCTRNSVLVHDMIR